jgi:hypothetical protein
MPRKAKTPTTERFTFCQPLSALYSDQKHIDKLRADIYATTEKLHAQIVALRNSIPTADNSDARNAVQYIVDRATYKVDDIQSLIHSVGDRKIIEYKQVREKKKRARTKDQDQKKKVKKPKLA